MARKRKPITAEEFAAWRADPVTEAVVKAFVDVGEQQKAAWLALSWDAGTCDETALIELKTRADAYRAISECTFEDIVGGES